MLRRPVRCRGDVSSSFRQRRVRSGSARRRGWPQPCGRFHQFVGQALAHGFLGTLLGGFTQPAHGQRGTAHRANFNRHLIVGTTHTTALDLDHRTGIAQCGVEDFDGILAALGADDLEGTVQDALGDGFLAGEHQHVDELGDFFVVIERIRQDHALRYFATAWHFLPQIDIQLALHADPGDFRKEPETPHPIGYGRKTGNRWALP